jgi:hypothetical protein
VTTFPAVAASSDAPGVQSGEGGSQPTLLLQDLTLFGRTYDVPTADYRTIDPRSIVVERCPTDVMVSYQRVMSRAIWRPAPGRKLGFIVKHDGDLLGILFLASTVINLGPRDRFLDLPTGSSERGKALRAYADLSVCVAVQPAGWRWNLGKMLALVAPTLGDYWRDAYGDDLLGMTTTSLWGRGSQYNRVWRFLGYTQGYGHEHVSDADYRVMVQRLRLANVKPSSARFGEDSSNTRMARILQYRRLSGDERVTVYHGNKRGIYYHPAVPSSERPRVLDQWYERWGRPRFDRMRDATPPYVMGLGA